MYQWNDLQNTILAKLDLTEEEANVQNLINRFPYYANEAITQICSSVKPKYSFAEFEIDKDNVGVAQKMPDDFVSFGDDVCYEIKDEIIDFYTKETITIKKELHDTDFTYHGYNQVIFKHPGKFYISYNARWITLTNKIDGKDYIDAPKDVLDCIPSYVASQCFKIDDEYKASVFRNEYEMMLARIDNTNYKNTKTFEIEGDW